ncbi:MAG: hypothetical protein Greene041662_669 [Candidatus Peregrinibacteria bacterium Greene0416_62]|nr:MAG: hypothetical protein Greene041662_669 [Candidatus Peregrinibacteria bacterium Greene0416_62]TSD00386.1 MAG: hypothetical protein Greene101449_185 [Candidatus Peregrinibacteria bacterium Greene1014_49]
MMMKNGSMVETARCAVFSRISETAQRAVSTMTY